MRHTTLLLVLSWIVQGCSGRSEAPEIAALRSEVEALKRELSTLKTELRATAPHAPAPAQDGAPAQPSSEGAEDQNAATVTFRFEVEPAAGARITVDGVPVENGVWVGPKASTPRQVEVQKPGYRIVRELVRPDRDRSLRYVLSPGRGVQHISGR
jgi:hypothetical protein